MRIWLSGPRVFHGLVRPGINFSHREAKAWLGRPPAANNSALAVVRRPGDGAMVLGVANHNGSAEDVPGHTYAGLFMLPSLEDALAVRHGAQQRLGVPVADDTWITGKSAGQVLAACRSEARDLGLEPQFVRVRTEAKAKERGEASGDRRAQFAFLQIVTVIVLLDGQMTKIILALALLIAFFLCSPADARSLRWHHYHHYWRGCDCGDCDDGDDRQYGDRNGGFERYPGRGGRPVFEGQD